MQLSGVKVVFQGSSALTLDAKGRISIPTRHRDALMSQADGRLTLTRHPDGCLLVYPRPEWEKKREQIAAFPMSAARCSGCCWATHRMWNWTAPVGS